MSPADDPTCEPAPTTAGDSPGETVQLLDLLDAELLQELQDQFSVLGGVSIQICDAAGTPLTEPSCALPACEEMATTERGRAACRQSAAAAIEGALRPSGEATRCPAGMVLRVAHVKVHERRVGSVVTANYPDRPLPANSIEAAASACGLDPQLLRDALKPTTRESGGARPEVHTVLADILTRLCGQRFEIRHRIEELGTVCDLTGILSGTGLLADTLSTTAAHICQMMKVTAVSIRLTDPETGRHVLRAAHNLSPEELEVEETVLATELGDRATVPEPGVTTEATSADLDAHHSEPARRGALVGAVMVPMAYRGDTVGVLHVYSHQGHRFTPFEGVLLRAIGSQIAAAVLNSRLYDQQIAAERYRQQLSYAAEVQQRMIPSVPAHPRITFGAVYDPHLEVGGDFYDFIELPRGHLGLSIADVVGKGVPAALLGASVRSALRAHAHSIFNINEIMSQVNLLLCRDTPASEFATVFYGVFAADASQLTYCNAGHEPPLLLRANKFFRLHTGGMVTGIDPSEEYQMDVVDLRSGDLIVFYTDGVTEALDFNDEQFGRERLMQSIRKYRKLEAPTLASQLLWDVRRFVGLARKTDDSSVVVAKVK